MHLTFLINCYKHNVVTSRAGGLCRVVQQVAGCVQGGAAGGMYRWVCAGWCNRWVCVGWCSRWAVQGGAAGGQVGE